MMKRYLPLGPYHPLVEALSNDNPTLARRLADCRPKNGKPCRQVACPHCRVSAAKKWRRATSKAFANAANPDCSSITINIAMCGSMEEVGVVVTAFRTALKNLRDRQTGLEGCWRGMLIRGVVEVEPIATDDVGHVYGRRRGVLVELPRHSVAGREFAYVPHAHLVVHHPGVSRADLSDVFARQWSGQFRVEVTPFLLDLNAASNAGNVISYATKHDTIIKIGSDKMLWPIEMQAEYWLWLKKLNRGMDSLAIRLGGRRTRRRIVKADDQAWADEMIAQASLDGLIVKNTRARVPQKKRNRDSSPSSSLVATTKRQSLPMTTLSDCFF